MLGRIFGAPVLLFLRHEAWTIDVLVREKRGMFDMTTPALVIALIMPWTLLAMVLMMLLLVILPFALGVDDAVISRYFGFTIMLFIAPIWLWGAHWLVIAFALRFEYRAITMHKQKQAHMRLAWWRGRRGE